MGLNWENLSVSKIWKLIQITLQYGCSPANVLHMFKTPFPNNTSGGQLLNFFSQETSDIN